ncbi:MAG: hypothetical protein A2521_08855 [Deltaproteobacteria bacterium RIFOXYD12_FULL_57_12]|nr:MAG: hypothetical protein A2521_08855 [Deltaproteobacteria bacterium RIFOXYD12_FULL_57_12]
MVRIQHDYPGTIEEAVDRLIVDMPLKDKAAIARMKEEELLELSLSLGLHIRDKFGLWSANKQLVSVCLRDYPCGEKEMYKDAASAVIIRALWTKLRETHALRLV